MDAKKSTMDKNIPIKHLKETSDICCDILSEIINNEIKNNTFPDELKLADITPIHKIGDATRTKNYRPVSVLPPISKIFEKFYKNKFIPMFKITYHHFYVDIGKDIQHNMLFFL